MHIRDRVTYIMKLRAEVERQLRGIYLTYTIPTESPTESDLAAYVQAAMLSEQADAVRESGPA